MKEEKQIERWLNGNLKGKDLEEFKQSYEFKSLQKIDKTAQLFKAPEFDEAASQVSINYSKKQSKPNKTISIFYKLAGIAALFIIGLFVGFQWFSTSTISIETAANQEEIITLPDNSKVYLNANSKLSYVEADFKSNRELYMEGEAFFLVEEGNKFIVKTPNTEVEVLGTSFNVKSRANFSQVDCYTGKVKVTDNHQNEAILTSSQRFANYKGQFEVSDFSNKEPGWIGLSKSSFNNTPFYLVLEELKLQYQVQIDAKNIDTSVYFSGSFTHKNLSDALESITLPLKIDYSIEENQVTLLKD